MAMNTPNVQTVYKAATATLAMLTGEQGQLIMDTTKGTLVVMDGTTAGGVPLAKESDLAEVRHMWAKRIEGAVPTGAALQAVLADVPVGGLVYFTEE